MSVLESAALQLWRAWFIESGNPWVMVDDGRTGCFFCSESQPDHDPDCVFESARRLLADADAVEPETTEITLHYPHTVRIIARQGGAADALEVPLADLLKFAFNLPISVFESMPADLMGDGRVDLSFANAIRSKLIGII